MKLPSRRHRSAEWIFKRNDPTLRYLLETRLRCKGICRVQVKERKKIFHANSNQKRAGMAILIAHETEFK